MRSLTLHIIWRVVRFWELLANQAGRTAITSAEGIIREILVSEWKSKSELGGYVVECPFISNSLSEGHCFNASRISEVIV